MSKEPVIEFLRVEPPGRRAAAGIVLTLVDLGDGNVRLTLDDVEKAKDGQRAWVHTTHVTWNDFDAAKLSELDDDQLLEDVGLSVLSRLLAHAGLIR